MSLNDMTVLELRKLAAEYDIAGRSTMKKAQLVAAIEFAYAKADAEAGELLDAVLGTEEDAIAQIRANIDAENEARAAAQRKRNRTNYATPNEVAVLRDATGRETTSSEMYPNGVPNVKVGFLRTEPGAALAALTSMQGLVRNAIVRKQGQTLILWDEELNFAVKANTFDKLAKRWAKEHGVWADVIDVARSF